MRTRRSIRKQSRQVGKGLHRAINLSRYSNIWCYYVLDEDDNPITFFEALKKYIKELMTSNNPIVKQFKDNKEYQLKLKFPESNFAENRNKTKEELLNKLVQKVRNAHQFRSSFRSCYGYSKATADEVKNIDYFIKYLIEPEERIYDPIEHQMFYDPENKSNI